MMAHIVGMPVEETALNFLPVAMLAGGIASSKLHQALTQRRDLVEGGGGSDDKPGSGTKGSNKTAGEDD